MYFYSFLVFQPSPKQDLYLVNMYGLIDLCSNKFHVSERSVLLNFVAEELAAPCTGTVHGSASGKFVEPKISRLCSWLKLLPSHEVFNMLQPLSPDPRIFPDLHHSCEAIPNWYELGASKRSVLCEDKALASEERCTNDRGVDGPQDFGWIWMDMIGVWYFLWRFPSSFCTARRPT